MANHITCLYPYFPMFEAGKITLMLFGNRLETLYSVEVQLTVKTYDY